MSPVNSKRKGSRGELAVVDRLKARGLDARRTAYSGAFHEKGDVALTAHPDLLVEVKCGARIDLKAAIRQAEQAAALTGQKPAVAWRWQSTTRSENTDWWLGFPLDFAAELIGQRPVPLFGGPVLLGRQD